MTGVQTCALPISDGRWHAFLDRADAGGDSGDLRAGQAEGDRTQGKELSAKSGWLERRVDWRLQAMPCRVAYLLDFSKQALNEKTQTRKFRLLLLQHEMPPVLARVQPTVSVPKS